MMIEPTAPRLLRILIVENHPDTLKWLTLYLEELGHTVFSARNLHEGIATFRECECTVLISDIGLPDGNGWQLLEQCAIRAPVFAIAMSGFGLNADSARSRAAGFRYHLLKPFKPRT